MGKSTTSMLAILMAMAAAAPALAQEAPGTGKKAPATSATPKPGGAVSSSYARCAPGQPIKGVIVKGGTNPTGKAAASEPEGSCPATGGAEAAAPAARDQMPSRLSMTPTTAKAAAEPPAPTGKSISEKGVAASKPHR